MSSARVIRRGGTAFVIDTDAGPVDVGALVRPWPSDDRPGDGGEVLGAGRGGPGCRWISSWRFESRADLEAVVRIELSVEVADAVLAEHSGVDGRLRGQPVVAAVLSRHRRKVTSRRDG